MASILIFIAALIVQSFNLKRVGDVLLLKGQK